MDFGISGKVALVCAASQGLGKASALALAREGVRVAICSRDEERINAAAKEISASAGTGSVLPVVADVSRASEIISLFQKISADLGDVDILVTNAGGPPGGSFEELDDDRWASGFEQNLMSVIRTIRAALPAMRKNRWGRIINITSLTVKQPASDLIVSSTLRPGIIGLSKILANRHGAEGITVNSVAPGFIMTARQEELGKSRAEKKGMTFREYVDDSTRDIPTGRFGTPEELGNVVAFLASTAASYVNGATISVDGGLVKGMF